MHICLPHYDAVFVASGTATLETALIGTPEVVCYKGNLISYWIATKLVDVKYISLVNLIMDRMIVKELIQHDLTRENLTSELDLLLKDQARREKIKNDYLEMREKLGQEGASERAAELIVGMLGKG